MTVDIDDFSEVRKCLFKGETYSVRDNGAVMRHHRDGQRRRPTDEKWTFGNPQKTNAYLVFGKDRIHRVVATAFHGEPKNSEMIVDHIDTNCRNNRPENLRWLTRLENALTNELTRRRIELACGSIESFLKNPRQLDNIGWLGNNLDWMRTVTVEEAQYCQHRMDFSLSKMRNEEPIPVPADGPHSKRTLSGGSSFKSRVYGPVQKWEIGFSGEPGLDLSSTPWCGYFNWSNVQSGEYFPSCPVNSGEGHFQRYLDSLVTGATLSCHDAEGQEPVLTAIKAKRLADEMMVVLVSRDIDKWSVIGIELYGPANYFVHFMLGTFTTIEEATNAFNSKDSSTDMFGEGYAGDMR